MFTGIITDIGILLEKSVENNQDYIYRIKGFTNASNIKLGSSICCSGICLTVIKTGDDWFEVNLSQETLKISNFKNLKNGDKINLEKSLKVGDELGGHFLTGHVDGTADLIQMEPVDGSFELWFEVKEKFIKLIAKKGSVAIDGISLTVNDCKKNKFSVNIINHTWQNTNLSDKAVGDKFNIEIDILSRYINRKLELMK